jgi:hypothetical protein
MNNRKIIIQEPCHENWDKMQPNAEGRHCASCCKTVVDFTDWKLEDIIAYLKSTNQNVCGRVQATVVAPISPALNVGPSLLKRIATAPLSTVRKIAAIIVLLFGVNYQTNAQSKEKTPKPTRQDIPKRPVIMGGLLPPKPTQPRPDSFSTNTIKGEITIETDSTCIKETPTVIQGKIAAPREQRK